MAAASALLWVGGLAPRVTKEALLLAFTQARTGRKRERRGRKGATLCLTPPFPVRP